MTPDQLHRERRKHLAALRAEVRRLTSELKKKGARKIWLIGSLANGTANLFSDADMVAVMPSKLPFVERLRRLYMRLGPANVDLLVYTPEEYEGMRARPFLKHALKTAKLLHAKRP
ncbi:MAG: nucleotidyltransferase domain-containing protein [Nitrospirae bacterium]|nr:nucleotidyltransferase domain-containing protein [Nitrospirota bacterium]